MDNLLFKINVSYLELARFRHSETMAKHQQQQAIVTLAVPGKSVSAAGIQKLLDFIWSQVFPGPFSLPGNELDRRTHVHRLGDPKITTQSGDRSAMQLVRRILENHYEMFVRLANDFS